MKHWKLHIPEGVQDYLTEECYLKRSIEDKLRRFFYLNGYDEIETPIFEYLDVFSGNKTSIEQEQMYKFFEPGSRIMVLRPDITMPIARIVSTKLKDRPLPLRLSYVSSVYRYEALQSARQREVAQAGIELLGAKGPEADAEVIAVCIQALLDTGLSEFQLDLGQVEFFKGLVEEAGLSDEDSEELRQLIDHKNMLALELFLTARSLPEELKNILMGLPMLFGNGTLLERAMKLSQNPRCQRALQNIDQVYRILKNYGLSSYITFDLGMVQSLNYYTGIIFRGITKELGYPVCGGGRYDNLLSEYGPDLPATGFAIGLKRVLMALERRQGLESIPGTDILCAYNPMEAPGVYEAMQSLRQQGLRVEAYWKNEAEDQEAVTAYAAKRGIPKIRFYDKNAVQEIPIDLHQASRGEEA